MYRIELLMASDKGKKTVMNIGAIPASSGIDIEKWQYYAEATGNMWVDPSEEGANGGDVTTLAKVIDLSLASDIAKYIDFAEYLKRQAGTATGITEQVEGQIGANEAVSNTRQNLVQSSHILEPYFELHNHVKKNALQALLELAKVAYSESKPRKLSYIMDDMSVAAFDLDAAMLDNSTLGLFVSNSTKAEEAKETIRQLTHAALQNQKVELSDVISVIRQEGIVEAEETLKAAEQNRREQEMLMQQQQAKAAEEQQKRLQAREREKFEEEKELIILKEEEKRKTEVVKAGLMGASFNPDMDKDGDGENDFIEIAKYGLDADIKQTKQQLDREQFEHQKVVDKKKLENESEKIKISKSKNNSKS